MATITINETILSGNLGDGWNDNDETADAYAKFIEKIWNSDVQAFRDAGHMVNISVTAQKRTSGYNGDVSIDVETDDDEEYGEYPTEDEVRRALSDTWSKWCDADEAKKFWAE